MPTFSSPSDSDWDRSTSDLTALVTDPVVFPSTDDHTPRRSHKQTEANTSVLSLSMEDLAIATPPARRAGCGTGAGSAGTGIENATATKKRTLSDLLQRGGSRSASESESEATRIADVLGQWINASSSPFEPETDDFFSPVPVHSSSSSLSPSSASLSPSPPPPALAPPPSSAPASSSLSPPSLLSPASASASPSFRRGSITHRGGVTVVLKSRSLSVSTSVVPVQGGVPASASVSAPPRTQTQVQTQTQVKVQKAKVQAGGQV